MEIRDPSDSVVQWSQQEQEEYSLKGLGRLSLRNSKENRPKKELK